jgi:cyclic pyranopterin phosphate synthase
MLSLLHWQGKARAKKQKRRNHKEMLQDKHGRTIDYLRISVTDRCDLRCISCMPPEGVPPLAHEDILRFEEIEAVVKAGTEMGIRKARLTGGEPLARLGVVSLAKKLCSVPGLYDLAVTSNGSQFAQHAVSMLEAGVRRVNFGIPSLDPAKYRKATRLGNLQDALYGLESAIQLGFSPIKINVVAMRGINDGLEDLRHFAELATKKPVHVRFIEYMPIGDANHDKYFVPAMEICQCLKKILKKIKMDDSARLAADSGQTNLAPLESNGQAKGSCQFQRVNLPSAGPAKSAWRAPSWPGSIAAISPVTGHICGRCNRLRLTADGHLRPCLFSKCEVSLKPALRPSVNVELLKSLFLEAIAKKPSGMFETQGFGRKMSQIGG